uniref:BED-type domain-containing protein n=1 Tax=Triticum urartu TaxID=4572 RepID=A0A8R7P818_TRIUA
MSTTPSASQPPGVGASSAASTVQGGAAVVNVKSKDPGWKYCICPDENKRNSLKCIFCHHVYTNGITRIKLHLANIPTSGVVPCTKVPADVRDEMTEFLTKKGDKKAAKISEQKRIRSEVDLSHSEGEGSSDEDGRRNSVVMLKSARGKTSKSSGGPMEKFCQLSPEDAIAARKEKSSESIQLKLTTGERLKKRNRACEYICQFFYEACIPFNSVTLPSFSLMLQSIGQYSEDLPGPSPYEMGGPFLKKRKKKVMESFKAHREAWELTGCTIMTDAWTDIRGRGVMNLVVHSAYGVVFLDSFDCSVVKKDGKYIFDLVDDCIEEIGEKHVVQVVTDNASVNQAASTLLNAKRPNIFWNGCAAHCIDLMLEDVGKLPSVDSTITKAR